MNTLEKVRVLGEASKFDSCASSSSNRKVKGNNRIGDAMGCGICHAFTQDGRCVSLFKTLYTNACIHDCKYCQNSNCESKIAKYEPDELASTFMKLYMRNYVEGLFLSSGVMKDADYTTEQMIEAVQLIRKKYNFQGYIHFKVLPGTSYELIKQVSEFADRVSVNLEAPNKSRLSEISSVKDFKIDILRRQAWIKRMKIPSGQTTQLVVGASNETDLEILKMVDWEYENLELKRGYYSAFVPVQKTKLEFKDKTPLEREHRLYNVDFMMRKYGFKLNEFKQIMEDGNLPKGDPKVHLARETLDGPIDINESNFDELVRIPGVGPLSAQRILGMQKRHKKITKYSELHNIGVVLKRATPFIKVDGKMQKTLVEAY